MPPWLEGVGGVLVALGTLFLALKAFNEIRTKSNEQQQEAWVGIRDSLLGRIKQLEADDKESRQRIKDLEAWEYTAKEKQIEDRQRIRELERINGSTADRLHDLEIDHAKVVKTLAIYRQGIALLLAQLKKLGVDPAWTPPDDRATAGTTD